MATISKGVLGGFSGKVGPVVGATWRGKDVMRSLPAKGSYIATPQRLQQQAKFRLVTRFVAPVKAQLSLYFGQPAGDKSRVNLATSYHLREAISGTYPDYQIDYPKSILTKGELLGLEAPTAAPQAGAVVSLQWQDNSGQSQAKPADVPLLFFYNPQQHLWHFIEAGTRAAATVAVPLPVAWTGDTVHCWISVRNAAGTLVANSVHLGGIVLL